MRAMSETPLGGQLTPAPYPPGWTVPPESSGPRRPGTVLAAAIVTWTASAVTLLGTASLFTFLMSAGEPILDSFDGSRPLLVAVAAGIAVWSVAACLLAWWALTGRNWARILLALSAGATVVVSTSMFWLGVPFVSLFGGIAVLVLLFIGGANDWYRTRPAARDPEGMS
jgi:hypothetical protein